jgi:hypothetical protein
MEQHWYVWLALGAMAVFAVVVGASALLSRSE